MTEPTAPRWFATRSSSRARTDEDRATAYAQVGPFPTREAARWGLAAHLIDQMNADSTIGRRYLADYAALLLQVAVDEHPELGPYTAGEGDHVTWTLWGADPPEARSTVVTLPVRPAPEPTPVTVALSVTELTPAMRAALLSDTPWRSQLSTRNALRRRGLLDRHDVLTEAGLRSRRKLEERRDARETELTRVADAPGAVIGRPPAWMQITTEGAAQLAGHLRVGIDGAAGASDDSGRYRQLLGFVESLVSSLEG